MPSLPDADAETARRDTEDRGRREKVIVRSNGTVIYVGKDMAYQFWKSGLLGQRFPLPQVCDAAGRRHVMGNDESIRRRP